MLFLLIVLPSILISFCYISIFAELKSSSSACIRPRTVEHQPPTVRSCMPFYHSNNPFFQSNFVCRVISIFAELKSGVKENVLLNFEFTNETTRANLRVSEFTQCFHRLTTKSCQDRLQLLH